MRKDTSQKPKILFYDIETTPLKAWVWSLGKQVVRHGQLDENHNMYDCICITYCWNDGKPAKHLDWGYHKQDSARMFAKFDKLIKKADVVIGKNNARFDNRHLNVHRWLNGQPGMPEWIKWSDDLEKHVRKHFYLPSYSLDYISDLLGLGGKIKMQFSDWIDIVEKKNKASFDKMIKYGKKDIEDTRAIWEHCESHFEPRYNAASKAGDLRCKHCGSQNICKNGTRAAGKSMYQHFYCNDHGGYAGKVLIKDNNWLGKIG